MVAQGGSNSMRLNLGASRLDELGPDILTVLLKELCTDDCDAELRQVARRLELALADAAAELEKRLQDLHTVPVLGSYARATTGHFAWWPALAVERLQHGDEGGHFLCQVLASEGIGMVHVGERLMPQNLPATWSREPWAAQRQLGDTTITFTFVNILSWKDSAEPYSSEAHSSMGVLVRLDAMFVS